MSGGRPLLACVAVAGAIVAGCGGPSRAADTSSPAADSSSLVRADSTVPCSARSEPPPAVSLRDAEGVTGSGARLTAGGQFDLYTFGGRSSRTRIGGRRAWLWKAPVALSADRSVVLTVNGPAARRARLGFARRARSFAGADRATRFASCAPDTRLFSGNGTVGEVTGWGGSLVTLDRRLCLRLRVVTATESVSLRVPLGMGCRRG